MTKWFLWVYFPLAIFANDPFRGYTESTTESVKEFYRQHHQKQTLEFVLQKKQEYLLLNHAKMDIWQAMELLDLLIDESDPDIQLPQSYHAYQTAEALRKEGYPRWLILTGFIHDLGKVLTSFNEPQWAIVGDTYPVGCKFSEKIVFSSYLLENPDYDLFDELGIYQKGCGFDALEMSWGHDEYLYHVVKDYLPEEALYIIRYHSFYPAHKEGAYEQFMNEKDERLRPWLKLFQQFDLYSKSNEPLDILSLKPYYQDLVSEFFQDKVLNW